MGVTLDIHLLTELEHPACERLSPFPVVIYRPSIVPGYTVSLRLTLYNRSERPM